MLEATGGLDELPTSSKAEEKEEEEDGSDEDDYDSDSTTSSSTDSDSEREEGDNEDDQGSDENGGDNEVVPMTSDNLERLQQNGTTLTGSGHKITNFLEKIRRQKMLAELDECEAYVPPRESDDEDDEESSVSTDSTLDNVGDGYEKSLRKIYRDHNPAKLHLVPEILDIFKGREESMIAEAEL